MKDNGKIEKGVPIPVKRSDRTYEYLKKMKIGDSTLMKDHNAASNCGAKYFGRGKYVTRRDGDKYRLWRTG